MIWRAILLAVYVAFGIVFGVFLGGGAVVIQVLHVLRLRVHARELLARAERAVDDGAGAEALQLRAHERSALARFHVLEVDDAPRLAIELDVHAVLELIRADRVRHGGRV